MVLLITTGLLLDGFKSMLAIDPGFRTDHLMSMELDPSIVRYSPNRTHDFYRQLVIRAQALPGVFSHADPISSTLARSILRHRSA